MTVIELQNAHLSSVFQPKEKMPAQRYHKTFSSSAVGRSGAGDRAAMILAMHGSSADAVSLRKIREAEEREDLEAIHAAFEERLRKQLFDAPMNNWDLGKLRRKASQIARRGLKQAVSEGSPEQVREALRIAEIADGPWLRIAGGVASTLEFKAAMRCLEEQAEVVEEVEEQEEQEEGVAVPAQQQELLEPAAPEGPLEEEHAQEDTF